MFLLPEAAGRTVDLSLFRPSAAIKHTVSDYTAVVRLLAGVVR